MKQASFFSYCVGNAIVCFILSMLMAGCADQQKGHKERLEDTVLADVPFESNTVDADQEGEYPAALYNFNTIGGEVISISASEQSEHDPFFLIGDANHVIVTKYLDKKIIKTDTLLKNEFVYTQIDSASIEQKLNGNNHYLLITAKETFKGQAITEKMVNFILVDVNTLEHYTLVYEGESSVRCYECIDGTFQSAPLLDKNPLIKTMLLGYANKSKWVYRPATQAEKDARHFINYEQKWNTDNGGR